MITYLHIHAINDGTSSGRLHVGQRIFPCILGQKGRAYRKHEGDGKTPVGIWMLQKGFYRSDRVGRWTCDQKIKPLRRTDAWCDDPKSGQYNKFISRPAGCVKESLWRGDCAYDLVFPTDHNMRPRVRNAGSAIFLHLTRPGVGHTAGCIAVSPAVMRKILRQCGQRICIVIWPSQGRLSVALRKSHFRP